MPCQDFNEFTKFILEIDQKVAIDKMKDKDLRYDVWKTTSKEISDLTTELSTEALPEPNQSLRIVTKLKNSLKRIRQSTAKGGTFQKDVMDHVFNKEMSIALHEMMESVKGEADKARNEGIDITSISNTGVLPALPLSRVAASIGRKIAFQKGYRFKRATNEDTAARIEAMYYDLGKEALIRLEKQGYVTLDKDVPTIMDYQEKSDLKKDFPQNDPTRSDVLSVSLDEKKLGIGTGSTEADYFLNRTEANLTDTDLGVITEKLNVANQILQPATIVIPDTSPNATAEEMAQWDDGVKEPDPKTAEARKGLYEKKTQVNKALHGLMQLMHEETKKTGISASKQVSKVFGTRKNMIRSLFGLKRSDDFSIDKKESVGGQNLSKTTPMDDMVEYYDLLTNNGDPADLHMLMKIGRNARLYYLNSVLNAHGSKQSRYMLTPGEYTVDTGTADFDFLVYGIYQGLGETVRIGKKDVKLNYGDILGGTKLDGALKSYEIYLAAKTVKGKLQAMGQLAREFPGVDYVSILTALQAVKDVREPVNGKVMTEYAVSSDATASGGTLTFIQALGTNTRVTEFLQRIGVLNPTDLVQKDLDDIYGLMTEAIDDFITDKPGSGLGADLGDIDVKGILQDTLEMLFIKSEETKNKDVREFSKDPTMTFVYGQGRAGAVQTLSRSLADRIIDNLDNPKTREYLTKIFDDPKYNNMEGAALRNTKDLYPLIVERLIKTELPGNIYDIMEDSIKNEFLTEYTARSEEVYDIIKLLPTDKPFKILPAGAVLSGKSASNPEDLALYGMPITKKVEVVNKFDGKDDTVLTRVEKLIKTVMDVSTTHGIDAALLYHSYADVSPKDGVVVIHDDVRGSVQTVRAMEAAYVETAKKMALEYDVHQQIMEAVAAQSPEIAASAEFKALKARIDKDMDAKKEAIHELFNDDTDSLIGDGKAFEEFANAEPEVDTQVETKVKSAAPDNTPLAKQDFGDTFITITEGDTSVEVLAQQYWNQLQSRLDMVDELRVCLTK
jgi:hypothetical protein